MVIDNGRQSLVVNPDPDDMLQAEDLTKHPQRKIFDSLNSSLDQDF